jgi:hypothetical protein
MVCPVGELSVTPAIKDLLHHLGNESGPFQPSTLLIAWLSISSIEIRRQRTLLVTALDIVTYTAFGRNLESPGPFLRRNDSAQLATR